MRNDIKQADATLQAAGLPSIFELIRWAAITRVAQRNYFQARTCENLRAVKRAEAELDKLLLTVYNSQPNEIAWSVLLLRLDSTQLTDLPDFLAADPSPSDVSCSRCKSMEEISQGSLGECPYAQEMTGETKICDCCEGCRFDCRMDI